MKHKKRKIIFFVIFLFLIIVLVVQLVPKRVVKGWSGTYSESKYKETILRYHFLCKSLSVKEGDENAKVCFKTSFVPKEGKVVRVAKVDEKKGLYYELDNYYDMFIGVGIEGKKITVTIPDREITGGHKLWSYLICITDEGGREHYYYCRFSYI